MKTISIEHSTLLCLLNIMVESSITYFVLGCLRFCIYSINANEGMRFTQSRTHSTTSSNY